MEMMAGALEKGHNYIPVSNCTKSMRDLMEQALEAYAKLTETK